MSTTEVILAAVGSAGGLFGAYAGVMTYLDGRGMRKTNLRKQAIAAAVEDHLKPMAEIHQRMENEIGSLSGDSRRVTETVDKNSKVLAGLSDRITVLETKMEIFWRNVGVELARVLHSPNPARAHVDELLEAWMENRITTEQRDELRGYLEYIRDYHQGDEGVFPVYAGDQVAAAIMLQAMSFSGAGKV